MRSFSGYRAALVGGSICAALCALPTSVMAQVSSINSDIVNSRVFNDFPSASFTSVNAYPGLVRFTESNVNSSTGSGFANRDVWYFSNNSGASAYQFQNNDFFDSSFSVNLTGGAAGKDIEAGYLFSNPTGSFGGDLQVVITGSGAVFQAGGPSYYPFSPAAGGFPGAGGSVANYTEGTTYTMGMNYVLDPNTGMPAFQYSVNGQFAASSPGDTYFDLAPGATIASTPPSILGGYFQIGGDSTAGDPPVNGSVTFSNISITPAAIPEPASLALIGMGIPFLFRRRRI